MLFNGFFLCGMQLLSSVRAGKGFIGRKRGFKCFKQQRSGFKCIVRQYVIGGVGFFQNCVKQSKTSRFILCLFIPSRSATITITYSSSFGNILSPTCRKGYRFGQ